MATEMITVKLESGFLNEIDDIVKTNNYQNRTEFIRNALREKVDEAKMKKAMMEIARLKGKSKKKTTDDELEKIRERVYDELYGKIK